MAVKSDHQEKLKHLLKSLDSDSAQTATNIIQVALMHASAVAAAKGKGVSESEVRKVFTDDIQRQYDDLLKKLNVDEQEIFKEAVEQAKINGAIQPELYASAKQ